MNSIRTGTFIEQRVTGRPVREVLMIKAYGKKRTVAQLDQITRAAQQGLWYLTGRFPGTFTIYDLNTEHPAPWARKHKAYAEATPSPKGGR